MKRTQPLKRHTPLRRTRLRAVNAKRRRRAFVRDYGSKQRVRFVHGLGCCVWGCIAEPVHCHHTETGGMGMKAGPEAIVPLCATHHDEAHLMGRQMFEETYTLDLDVMARRTELLWQEHINRDRP